MGEKSKRSKSADKVRMTIARSRERVNRDLRGLHYELDFPAKLQRSYRKRTVFWLAVSTAVGVVMVLLLTRKKKVYVDPKSGQKVNKELVESGFALGALKIGASLVQPAIIELVKKRLRGASDHPRAKSREGF
jgi:hypothetical protein